ncbi:histone acetyltransferase SCDLUD_000203 [Saccharomycodes ludwigii]|uniref:histone acetyltransferase n=1 Tax=Saccharomycodes ludwigii TaxID=36035 RepID=UPI001E8481B9|nr:hypothetical protein SCDLUD_000203 [Saccharomycodes ludwigii]KAH3902623.1 hypothetical protein SCDLUD_000203 [Saccharomycodes ludwigii]
MDLVEIIKPPNLILIKYDPFKIYNNANYLKLKEHEIRQLNEIRHGRTKKNKNAQETVNYNSANDYYDKKNILGSINNNKGEESEREKDATCDSIITDTITSFRNERLRSSNYHTFVPQYTFNEIKPNEKDYLVYKEIKRISQNKHLNFIDQLRNTNTNNTTNNNNNNNNNNNTKIRQPSINKNQNIQICFQNKLIESWYKSPYPLKSYNYPENGPEGEKPILYICDYCFHYTLDKFKYYRHECKCSTPSGKLIYNDSQDQSQIRIYELDGLDDLNVSRNLCLFSKLFLNSKTLYYDVEPFLFYLVFHRELEGRWNFIGYFSKEKISDNNLSCILTNPIYQNHNWGQFMINFSYILNTIDYNKLGTPEKPLSDLGLLSYRKFWRFQMLFIMQQLLLLSRNISFKTTSNYLVLTLKSLATLSGMTTTDVIFGLEQLGVLYKERDTRCSQNKNSGSSVDSNKSGKYCIICDVGKLEVLLNDRKYLQWLESTKYKFKMDRLVWKPPLFGPSGGINTQVSVPDMTAAGNINRYNNEYLMGVMSDRSNYLQKINQTLSGIIECTSANNLEVNSCFDLTRWEPCKVEYFQDCDMALLIPSDNGIDIKQTTKKQTLKKNNDEADPVANLSVLNNNSASEDGEFDEENEKDTKMDSNDDDDYCSTLDSYEESEDDEDRYYSARMKRGGYHDIMTRKKRTKTKRYNLRQRTYNYSDVEDTEPISKHLRNQNKK